MILEFNMKCSSCGESKYLTANKNDNGIAIVCKNLECEGFNGFTEIDFKYFYREMLQSMNIKNGFTGEVEFEEEFEEGKIKEIFENGELKEAFELECSKWVKTYPDEE